MRFKDNDIIEGIKCSNHAVLKYVYSEYFPLIKWNLFRSSILSEDEIKDIFQDAIIIIFKNTKKDDFVLKYTFKTYLFSICKILFLKWLELKKSSNESNLINIDDLSDISADTNEIVSNLEISNDEVYEIKQGLIRKHFINIPKDCQKILKMFSKNVSNKQIAEKMGFKSEDYAKFRKHKCKGFLIKKIKKDKLYNTIKNQNI